MNFPATPAFFIIDHKGVIRRRCVGNLGAKVIDAALERLIRDAEEAVSPK
ncbi:MAG: hypothetical protein ACI8UO_001478 [Verrucomicrobiales bacterium]